MAHPKTGWEVVRWWALWLTNGGKRLVECGIQIIPGIDQIYEKFEMDQQEIRRNAEADDPTTPCAFVLPDSDDEN